MRYKIIYVSGWLLTELFRYERTPIVKVANPLPEDTKYIRSFTDDNTGHGRIGVVIESSKFEDLKDGDIIPVYTLMIEAIVK